MVWSREHRPLLDTTHDTTHGLDPGQPRRGGEDGVPSPSSPAAHGLRLRTRPRPSAHPPPGPPPLSHCRPSGPSLIYTRPHHSALVHRPPSPQLHPHKSPLPMTPHPTCPMHLPYRSPAPQRNHANQSYLLQHQTLPP
uniref:Uncharacterized protein n=1 Tax=Knipowitschia caucasica TaxID=637954 RepID=A0AAV2MCK5_KNICA